MKLTWMHYVLMVCTVMSAGSEALAHYAEAGNQLPFHLAAGTLLFVSMLFGTISKSMVPPAPQGPDAPPAAK